MKKFLILLFTICFVTAIQAQDERLDDYNWDETDYGEGDAQAGKVFTFGFGYHGSLFLTDFNEVNTLMNDPEGMDLGLSNLKGGMYNHGLEFFTTVGLIDKLRLAIGHNWGAKLSEETVDGYHNSAELLYNATGFSLGYSIVLVKSFQLMPWLGFNYGTLSAEMGHTPEENKWGGLPLQDDGADFYKLTKNFINIEPGLLFEWHPTDIVMFRASATYRFEIYASDWYINGKSTISDVPTRLAASGLNFGFGVFVGLFDF